MTTPSRAPVEHPVMFTHRAENGQVFQPRDLAQCPCEVRLPVSAGDRTASHEARGSRPTRAAVRRASRPRCANAASTTAPTVLPSIRTAAALEI